MSAVCGKQMWKHEQRTMKHPLPVLKLTRIELNLLSELYQGVILYKASSSTNIGHHDEQVTAKRQCTIHIACMHSHFAGSKMRKSNYAHQSPRHTGPDIEASSAGKPCRLQSSNSALAVCEFCEGMYRSCFASSQLWGLLLPGKPPGQWAEAFLCFPKMAAVHFW